MRTSALLADGTRMLPPPNLRAKRSGSERRLRWPLAAMRAESGEASSDIRRAATRRSLMVRHLQSGSGELVGAGRIVQTSTGWPAPCWRRDIARGTPQRGPVTTSRTALCSSARGGARSDNRGDSRGDTKSSNRRRSSRGNCSAAARACASPARRGARRPRRR